MENDIFVNLQILSFLYTYLNIHKPVWSLVIIGIFRCYLVLYKYVFFISHHTRTEEMHFVNKVGVVSGYCLLWVVVSSRSCKWVLFIMGCGIKSEL
jgi:hypothetical protein